MLFAILYSKLFCLIQPAIHYHRIEIKPAGRSCSDPKSWPVRLSSEETGFWAHEKFVDQSSDEKRCGYSLAVGYSSTHGWKFCRPALSPGSLESSSVSLHTSHHPTWTLGIKMYCNIFNVGLNYGGPGKNFDIFDDHDKKMSTNFRLILFYYNFM